jgi:hypothetical protein
MQIFDEESPFFLQDDGVAPAHGRYVEGHFAFGTPANDSPLALEFESRAGSRPFDNLQEGHDG